MPWLNLNLVIRRFVGSPIGLPVKIKLIISYRFMGNKYSDSIPT